MYTIPCTVKYGITQHGPKSAVQVSMSFLTPSSQDPVHDALHLSVCRLGFDNGDMATTTTTTWSLYWSGIISKHVQSSSNKVAPPRPTIHSISSMLLLLHHLSALKGAEVEPFSRLDLMALAAEMLLLQSANTQNAVLKGAALSCMVRWRIFVTGVDSGRTSMLYGLKRFNLAMDEVWLSLFTVLLM